MSPPILRRCIVFDDDEHQLRERRRQVEEVLDYLNAHGKLVFTQTSRPPNLIASQQRAEVLESVYDEPDTLLIADLTADAPGPAAGNLGARLVRAIAENPRTAERTRRVMWSRHNVSHITEGMRRWAHAFALYDVEGADDLADAILHALGTDEQPWDGPREFPAARTPARWSDQVRVAVGRLVNKPRPADDLIALRLAADVDRVQINAELRRSTTPNTRPDVSAFITQIINDSDGVLSADDAAAEIRKVMVPFAVDQVADPIRPQDCKAAKLIRHKLIEKYPNGRHLRVTWLTSAQDELLAEFLSLYAEWVALLADEQRRSRPKRVQHSGGVRTHNRQTPNDAIQRILGVEDFLDPDPRWQEAMNRTGLDADDLAYAIWTLIDTERLR